MTLWELAKKILYQDSRYQEWFRSVRPENKETMDARNYKGHHANARDHLHNFTLRECGIANNTAYVGGPHCDLFMDEDAFWSDYYDHEFGRVAGCGEKAIDGQGQLIIHTGWYRWSDGSVRSSIEK